MAALNIVLNAGSSSLKFQVFDAGVEPGAPLCRGLFEGLAGDGPAHFVARDGHGQTVGEERWQAAGGGHDEALRRLIAWLRDRFAGASLAGVGHRVVHGGADFTGPVLVDPGVVDDLERFVPLAPLHQPHNLRPIRFALEALPGVPQAASFDTAFHRTQPELAQLFAIPRAMTEQGVRRYGFHGLSYEYIASVMGEYDPALAKGRVVVAHLGNGASACALRGGVSIASTMGFSALDGLMMGTRCGSLDPAVVFYMLREMKLTPDAAEKMLYSQCGLLGVSGLSNDMRTLRAKEAGEPHAREAIALYVYRIVREVGSLAAALGGLDGLIFTAGIGENDAATRAAVLDGLAFLGFRADPDANAAGGPKITSGPGPSAWVIPTNEELVVARHMRALIGNAA